MQSAPATFPGRTPMHVAAISFPLAKDCFSAMVVNTLTDNDLVAATLRGDMRAFELLMRRHERMLLRTARAILRDDGEAEDAVQEACLKAFAALASFRGEAKVSTWLVRIAANEALMRRRQQVSAPADAAEYDAISPADGPEGDAAQHEMRDLLDRQIESLPREFQAVFRMRALEELTVRETAHALRIPEATVRTRYFRACRLLRDSMARGFDRRADLPDVFITGEDLARLSLLNPHAALLREMERAVIVSRAAAVQADAVTMNSQVLYTDETTGAARQVNLVFPHEVRACACTVCVLTPVGSALIGLPAGQAIDWSFADGRKHRLRVERVTYGECAVAVISRP
jgi:RNA polymerase sigma-70 factor, ECF subfamily